MSVKKFGAILLSSIIALCVSSNICFAESKNIIMSQKISKDKKIYLVETSGVKGFNNPFEVNIIKYKDISIIEKKIDDRYEKIEAK